MSRRPALALLAANLAAGLTLCAGVTAAFASSRIKDLASVEGVRQNQLVGYGLVVGLNGTGDTLEQLALHQAEPAGDAGAARRQHPRRQPAHRATSRPSW